MVLVDQLGEVFDTKSVAVLVVAGYEVQDCFEVFAESFISLVEVFYEQFVVADDFSLVVDKFFLFAGDGGHGVSPLDELLKKYYI